MGARYCGQIHLLLASIIRSCQSNCRTRGDAHRPQRRTWLCLSFEVSDSDAASISEEVFNIDMPKAKNAEDLNCKLSVSDDLDLSTRPINESDFEISFNTSIKRSNKNRLGKSASQEDLREIEASADDF